MTDTTWVSNLVIIPSELRDKHWEFTVVDYLSRKSPAELEDDDLEGCLMAVYQLKAAMESALDCELSENDLLKMARSGIYMVPPAPSLN